MRLDLWTEEEERILKTEKLKTETWGEFRERKLPHRTLVAINKKAYKMGISSPRRFWGGFGGRVGGGRLYTYNDKAWEILTPESCYWSGFLAADGCVKVVQGKNPYYSVVLALQESDTDHLIKFANFCEYTGPVHKPQLNTGGTYLRTLSISCKEKWVTDLEKNFSITPRKTFTLQPPNIKDKHLIDCFILGFLDGDGCVYFNKKRIEISAAGGSKPIMEWIMNRLDELLKPSYIKKPSNPKKILVQNDNLFKFSITDAKAVALMRYFKDFPVPKLERKWNNKEVNDYIKERVSLHPHCFNVAV